MSAAKAAIRTDARNGHGDRSGSGRDAIPGGAHPALRAATAAVHERLHHLPAFGRIVDGSIARDDYRALLERLYGFHAALDARFAARADVFARYGIDLASRARLPLLVDDLAALGAEPFAIAALPRASLSPLASGPSMPAALFGQLYVREGSTLGGRVIARHLDHLLGADARGRAFFSGDSGNGARWRETCDALERVASAEPTAIRDLATGATACFADFERWMA